MQELINKILAVYSYAVSSDDDAQKILIAQQATRLVEGYANAINIALAPSKQKEPSYEELSESVDAEMREELDNLVIPEPDDKSEKKITNDRLANRLIELQEATNTLLDNLADRYEGDKKVLRQYENDLKKIYLRIFPTEELKNLYRNMTPGTNIPSLDLPSQEVGTSGSSTNDRIETSKKVKPLSDAEVNLFSNIPKPPAPPPVEGAELIDDADPAHVKALMQRFGQIYVHRLLTAIRNAIPELEAYVGHTPKLVTLKAQYETSRKDIAPAIAYLLNLSLEAIEKNKIARVEHDTTQIENRLLLAREAQELIVAEAKRIYENQVKALPSTEVTLEKLWHNPSILRHAWNYTQAEKTLAQIDRALALNNNDAEQVKALDAQINELTAHQAELMNPTDKKNLPGNIPIPQPADPNVLFEQHGDSNLKAISKLLKAYLKVLGIAHQDELNNADVREITHNQTQLKIPLIRSQGPEAELSGSHLLRSHLPDMLERLKLTDDVLKKLLEKTKEEADTLTDEKEINANLLEQQQIGSYLNYIPMMQAWINHHKPTEAQTKLAYYGNQATYIEGNTQEERIKAGIEKGAKYLEKHDANTDPDSLEFLEISSADLKLITEKKGEYVLYGEGAISLADSAVDAAHKNKALHYASLQFISPKNNSLRTGLLLSANDSALLASLPPHDPAVMAAAYKIVQTHAAKLAENEDPTEPNEWKIRQGELPDSVYKAIFIACKLQGIEAVSPPAVNPRTRKPEVQFRLRDDDRDFLIAEVNLKAGHYKQITQDKTFTHRAELQRAEQQFDDALQALVDEPISRPRPGG